MLGDGGGQSHIRLHDLPWGLAAVHSPGEEPPCNVLVLRTSSLHRRHYNLKIRRVLCVYLLQCPPSFFEQSVHGVVIIRLGLC